MDALFETQRLGLTYPDGTVALRSVSLRVMPGEMVAVIGSSGAGKSTLLRCLNGLLRPSAGRVLFMGRDVHASAESARLVRRDAAMIFQHFGLVPRISALTNVALGRAGRMPVWRGLLGAFSAAERQAALRALERVGILPQWRKRSGELSGGQAQRVAIARALCQQPRALLADEPVSSLDPATARQVLEHATALCREDGITLIANLHSVGLARAYSRRIIAMQHGSVIFDGAPELLDGVLLREIYGAEIADV